MIDFYITYIASVELVTKMYERTRISHFSSCNSAWNTAMIEKGMAKNWK